jgi:hypothetical protein
MLKVFFRSTGLAWMSWSMEIFVFGCCLSDKIFYAYCYFFVNLTGFGLRKQLISFRRKPNIIDDATAKI